MEDKYYDGDVILFYRNPSPHSEQSAVMVNGDDATFKQVHLKENYIVLHPYNNRFEDKVYTKEEIEALPVKILGVAQSIEYRDLR